MLQASKLSVILFLVLFLGACHFAGSRRVSPPASSGHYAKGGVRGTKSYTIRGKTYYPLVSAQGFVEEGVASWYGKDFHGKKTANGERYNMYGMTAAHKTLPLGTMVRVTNKDNGRSIVVRVNDRGPFVDDRIIDLTKTGAQKLDMLKAGTARVKIESLNSGSSSGKKNSVTSHKVASSKEAIEQSRSEMKSEEGRFFIQTGAFSTKSNANTALESLKRKGIQARVLLPSGSHMWRVQAGPYATKAQAQKVKGNIKGFILSE